MTNKEKFGDFILDELIGRTIAVNKKDGKPCLCDAIECDECGLDDKINGKTCNLMLLEWLEQEYEPKVDWTKVPVDTKILVRDYEDDEWGKRYFAKYENNKVCAFLSGATSWSSAYDLRSWKYAKLAEDEE